MASIMVTLHLEPEEADVETVRRKFDLAPEEIDGQFGVVCIDPDANLHTILVNDGAAERLQGREGIEGTWSNPRIEPI